MRFIGLDLSKRSTGWAMWGEGDALPTYGNWQLGSEFTCDGKTFVKLHECLSGLHMLGPITHIAFEDPLHPAKMQGGTNISSLRVLTGLAAHAESWGEAMRCRQVIRANNASWRKHFVGGKPRGTKRQQWKEYVTERCRSMGLHPANDDQADAIGILSWVINANGITPPWWARETLPLMERV